MDAVWRVVCWFAVSWPEARVSVLLPRLPCAGSVIVCVEGGAWSRHGSRDVSRRARRDWTPDRRGLVSLIGIGAARHCAGVDGRCGPCLDVPRTCLEFDFVPVLRDGSLMIRTAGIDMYLCFVALCLARVFEVFFKRKSAGRVLTPASLCLVPTLSVGRFSSCSGDACARCLGGPLLALNKGVYIRRRVLIDVLALVSRP